MNPAICQAIQNRKLLQISYKWGYRTVEPHAYGRNDNGHDLLRVYQVSGQSDSDEPIGWKLLNCADITGLHVLEQSFSGPRLGYKPRDKAMNQRIYCEI